VLVLLALPLQAETVRLAFWNTELNRAGPGLLLRDLTSGEDPQIAAVISVLVDLNADVLVLTGIDYDRNLTALSALEDLLAAAGHPYPQRFALPPNAGGLARPGMRSAMGVSPGKAGSASCRDCRLRRIGRGTSRVFCGGTCRAR
jgi:hypothetical protein